MSKLVFDIVKNGYDPESVDAYVDLLREEYVKLYKLRIESEDQGSSPEAEIILAEAKRKAKEIEARAILEANRIIEQAQNACIKIGDEFRVIISHMQPFMDLKHETQGDREAC